MTASHEEPPLLLQQEGHIATVFLNRPDKRNAINMAMFDDLPRVMGGLGRDDEVRVVVMAAKGPAFSVGIDLNALAEVGGAVSAHEDERPSVAAVGKRIHADVLRLQASISSVADCPKPVIAAIQGYCLGGGVDLASACDIRLCAADAVFSVRETRMAMVADIGSLQRLPELMPYGFLAELAFTGKDIDATRAERIGFVNAVYPDAGTTLEAAKELATDIAANSPLAVQGTKAVLAEAKRARVEAGLRFVAAWNAGQLHSDDLGEAVTAFFEKRPPKFTGN